MKTILPFMLGVILAISCPALASDDDADDQYCGMLPEAVTSVDVYAGWSACNMKRRGERAIWQELPKGTKQVTRFIFTQGHGMFFRVVKIIEYDDGTAELKVFGARNRNHYRKPVRASPTYRRSLSLEEVSQLSKLSEEAGAWEFEIGTWDKNAGENGDEMEIYMHCQVLEMERANADGYRFSSVNIGCNQPIKLMPLVNEIVKLGRMKNTHNGMLFE